MKTTLKILSLVSFLSLSFAGVAQAGEGAARKGQVNVSAAAAKAVVAGPAVVKVYSGFSGADGNCGTAPSTGTTLVADRVETVSVGAGQVACVAATGDRSIELLWHTQSAAPAAMLVANR
jgi:predicted secreted protein